MPTLAELRSRYSSSAPVGRRPTTTEEMLVSDARSQMTPKDAVEQKLGAVLRRSGLQRGLVSETAE